VIWWQGYGAYIGSANLSDRAWNSNIEAGLFFNDVELYENNLISQLEEYFAELSRMPQAFPLTREIVDELEKIKEARSGEFDLDKKAMKLRSIDEFHGLVLISGKSSYDRKMDSFRSEWLEALTYLRNIAEQVVNYKPSWVNENVPASWQADQMLHAYYYNCVREGNRHPFEEYHLKNKSNPAAALKEVLIWWSELNEPPTSEDMTFYEYAPFIRSALSKGKLLDLTLDEFEKVCGYTHATLDHLIKVSVSLLGVHDRDSLSRDERLPLFAKWLWEQRNNKGQSVIQLVYDILYGGDNDKMWERLYHATHDSDLKIPHYGINSIGEIIGWALPEISPPRNGRTSKALRALGYDVRIHF
jgi:hypothetical protein